MNKDEVILKPCPYCGGRAYFAETLGKIYIKCEHTAECGICPDGWLGDSDKPIEQKIYEWNARYEEPKKQIKKFRIG